MTAEEFNGHIIPYSRKLYPMVRRILKNDEETRDALQELMMKLWGKRFELGRCTNLNAYIMSMAKNHCLDVLKKKRPERLNGNEEYKILNLQSDEKIFELKERHEQVSRIIGGLPEKYREILQFRDIDGLSFEEIKELTGLEVPHIRVILSRSRQRVKSELEKIYNYEQGTVKKLAQQVL